MIDLELYRVRVGNYTPRCKWNTNSTCNFKDGADLSYALNSDRSAHHGLYLYFYYFFIIVYLATMKIILNQTCVIPKSEMFLFLDMNFTLVHMKDLYQYKCITDVKYFYVILISFILRKRYISSIGSDSIKNGSILSDCYQLGYTTRIGRIMSRLLIWLAALNFLLIAIVNPSLLNPGPGGIIRNCSVFYLNVRGLIPWGELNNTHPLLHKTKLHDLNTHIEHSKPDIVIYNETWLKPSISDNEVISTDIYKVFRLDRSSFTHPPDPVNINRFRSNGGGVLIGIKHNLDIQTKLIPVKCRAEILSIEITDSRNRKSIISTFYRVGTLGSENHNRIDQYLRNIRRRRGVDEITLIGDLNMCDTNWEDFSSDTLIEQLFIDTFNDIALSQVVMAPTHNKGNILDIILTDKPDNIHNIDIDKDSGLGCSDHFPIKFNLKLSSRRKKSTKRYVYNFKKADWVHMNSDFENTDWDSIFANKNMEDSWDAFKVKFLEVSNRHIPRIKINDEFQPPWYDSEVHELFKKKQWFHKRWKKSKSDLHYIKFAECRKLFKNLVEKKLEDNFTDETNNNLITKKFWSYIKSKSNSHRIPEVISYNNRVRSSPKDQSELFNEYFYDQFSSASAYNIDLDFTNDEQYKVDFSPNLIKKHLIDINPNKAQGPDLIHGRILKTCANSLAHPLSKLFMMSYKTGCIPADWKIANVVPIHKKGSKIEASNYRPISLTSLVMKIYEKVIRDELLSRCGHLIDQRQHGFMASKSCCTQMVDFCDSLALSLNDNVRTDIIYFDFQKAFDSVNHDIILSKLKYQYKIDGSLLRFFVSYLKERYQRVVINNEQSSLLRVKSGVPQGSILGPTLFILFLNDITEGLSEGTNITMYADDTKVWRRIIKTDDHYIIQRDIDHLLNWATRNKMTFHPDKCKVLPLTNGHRPVPDFVYTMADKIIEYTNLEKDLGIHINGKLNWNAHCEYLYSRANQKLGLLKRTCSFINNDSKRRALYLSLIRSQLEHCPIIWRPSAQNTIDRLESIQKRALKWVIGDPYISFTLIENYYKTCKQVNILPISFRFDFRDLLFFHSVFYSYSVTKLPDYLTRFAGSRLRRSHYDSLSIVSSIMPRIPQNLNSLSSTLGISKSFFYRAHLAWNKIPFDIRDLGAPSKFKTALMNYLWRIVSDLVKTESDK